jgi:hypothetical protein
LHSYLVPTIYFYFCDTKFIFGNTTKIFKSKQEMWELALSIPATSNVLLLMFRSPFQLASSGLVWLPAASVTNQMNPEDAI